MVGVAALSLRAKERNCDPWKGREQFVGLIKLASWGEALSPKTCVP
jgi:hypothetical protein